MTNTTRDLLISLSSHMAYMQGQLEARHELDDPENFYWYRESVALRQKVTDALADEPAVPEGREPAAVTGQRSDEELLSLDQLRKTWNAQADDANNWDVLGHDEIILWAQRQALARWGSLAPAPPADGEVAELVGEIRHFLAGYRQMRGLHPEQIYSIHCGDKKEAHITVSRLTRAAELLQRQALVPVSVSERWPEFSDCDGIDRVWCWSWALGTWRLSRINRSIHTHWLPAHALPLPEVNE